VIHSTLKSFLDALHDHRLVPPDRLATLGPEELEQFDGPQALGLYLVQKGWLTFYQLDRLFHGNGHDLIVGCYRILELIGEGGASKVFKAEDMQTKQLVALKVLRADRLSHAESVDRFRLEVHLLTRLSHPNIVKAYDTDLTGTSPYVALEYVEGTNLAELVQLTGPVPLGLACQYIRQAAAGLQHAYEQGLVHRDVKPANLILAGRDGVIKILDMGIARLCRPEGEDALGLTSEGAVMGTADYMAPEQALDARTADIRSDIYGLGCTLYHLLTGQPPFPGGSLARKLLRHQREAPASLNLQCVGVPSELAAVIDKMLSKCPDERFQVPAEVAQALSPFCPQQASQPSPMVGCRAVPPKSPAATILVVEDGQLNREMLSRRLARHGYQVITAHDGRQGVLKAQTSPPDLILMDMSMPVMDGWEATRLLKAAPTTHAIPVIALTAHAMPGDRHKAIEAGCNDYETKPVDFHRLLGKIRGFLADSPISQSYVAAQASLPQPEATGKVLVIEDNDTNNAVRLRRLQRQGYEAVAAATASAALELIRRHAFDLVLLDMTLPEINGLELLGIIRASYSTTDLPVVILTAGNQEEIRVSALHRGANDYLIKPVNYPLMLVRIQDQLALRQAHQTGMDKLEASDSRMAKEAGSEIRSSASPSNPPFACRLPQDPLLGSGLDPDALSSRDTLALKASDTRSGEQPEEPPAAGELVTVLGYQVLSELARGRMGRLYQARQVQMNRLVTLKVLDKQHFADPAAGRRFAQEIQAAVQLNHPNIIQVFDVGTLGDQHFLAREYVQGVNLRQRVEQAGPLGVEEACSFMRQAALGLQHAHERGLVHRDIKPAHLLATYPAVEVEERATVPLRRKATIKILDFGLAALAASATEFMAPEQWLHADLSDIRADLFSLGCTFYFLLAGQVPFPEEEPFAKMLRHHLHNPEPVEYLRKGVPPKVASVVRRLMAIKPEQRFQQPIELVEALQ